jgi:hypothetical protein
MEFMKPFLHELVISVRSLDDRSKKGTMVKNKDYKVNLNYFKRETSGTAESILKIHDLIIPARSEIVIHFGIEKTLMQFEKYTNDPSRGFNIM